MNTHYYKTDPWCIIEEGFNPEMHKASESIFSLGNGAMGQRANFEETYSGETLQGNYIAGIYYPDKTVVGWWKNGYPEYFGKIPNSPNWLAMRIFVEDEELDMHKCKVLDFRRELNMKHGYLQRSFVAEFKSGKKIAVNVLRFLSIVDDEAGVIQYRIKALNFKGEISITSGIDGDVKNEDANYDEKFWETITTGHQKEGAFLHARTHKSHFESCMSVHSQILINNKEVTAEITPVKLGEYSGERYKVEINEDHEVTFYKYAAILSSLNYNTNQLIEESTRKSFGFRAKGFEAMLTEHRNAWNDKWRSSDIAIEGDEAAQQAIRFNIFHLNQTYTGKDPRLNIGPKGFTGEKYGGLTYWDTEAFLIPFYLSTATAKISRNLLMYRYKHLQKAIENAEKLGFSNGAALYPMVTINGEESHNEWEITFEEIHRNGAIAHAIYNYTCYTGDDEYLIEYGIEVLIAISRFWRQRVNWSDVKGAYVMLGVTGPNEYENNVNNNWYTNKLARWTLTYTVEVLDHLLEEYPARFNELEKKMNFSYKNEIPYWKDIMENMYFPMAEKWDVFLQQDGYLDKNQRKVSQLTEDEKPINQHWSWDRILRSCFIKQADVLQGIYLFEDEYDTAAIKRNFEFYEPRTVHESSLSPCIHAVLAARIGDFKKAYEMYLRTSRLDLDDYNKEVDEGLHITSMGGTWMALVYGFGGLRLKEDQLHINPALPQDWKSLSFRIIFRDNILNFTFKKKEVIIENIDGPPMELFIHGHRYSVSREESIQIAMGSVQKVG